MSEELMETQYLAKSYFPEEIAAKEQQEQQRFIRLQKQATPRLVIVSQEDSDDNSAEMSPKELAERKKQR
jgi:hypothetical protein